MEKAMAWWESCSVQRELPWLRRGWERSGSAACACCTCHILQGTRSQLQPRPFCAHLLFSTS